MSNLVSGQQVIVGDLLLNVGKLNKYLKVRLGTGGSVLAGSSEINTTVKIPDKCLIVDAFLEVLTPSTGATKTVRVGLLSTSSGGNGAGFLKDVSVGSSGTVRGAILTATSGGNTGGTMLVSATLGTYLATFSSGSTGVGDPGFYLPGFTAATSGAGTVPIGAFRGDSVTAKSITWTPGSTDWVAFKANLYIGVVDLVK